MGAEGRLSYGVLKMAKDNLFGEGGCSPLWDFWLTIPLLAVPQVSKAAADLMTYCDAHACEDPLITPVPTSENPFREKKFFCALL